MKKILTVLIAFILGNAMFAQKEIVPQKKSYTETYKILEKYKIAPTGNSYLFTDSIICELSGVVYHIKDDGKNCTLTFHVLGSTNLSPAFPLQDLVITGCIKSVLVGYKGNNLMSSMLLVERKDSEEYNFLLTYIKADSSVGNFSTSRELIPVEKSMSLKNIANSVAKSYSSYKWYIDEF
ncbi:hypothetical protein [Treponema sp.]|uniref:hypothetical protein n=1 Tax=Treponema sp. TaxID=166 RepID=UPI0025CC1FCF|nr:hypothetical protein [Treponema sp.]MBR4323521.1 hypothetical protein [Treponema sp.]